MAIQSMTGFATSQSEWPLNVVTNVPITITVKVLNSRFFETTFRMPHIFSLLEQSMAQRCKAAFRRGSVTITIHLGSSFAMKTIVIPSPDVAKGYVDSLRAIGEACNIKGDVTLRDLILLPHLFESCDEPLSKDFLTFIMEQFDTIVADVVVLRKREGEQLESDIRKLMYIMSDCLEALVPRAEAISRERRERFLESIATSIAAASASIQQQHIQALYQQMHTIDTHEEIVRFRAHYETFLVTLEDAEIQKGKKLDFIVQEMFREINTLSSKLADVQSLTPILTIKTKLEQIREQVQNIV